MATGRFNLDDFRSKIFKDSLARTNRFEVDIAVPGETNSDIVSLYCEQASLPMLSINTRQQKTYGPLQQRPISSEYGGEGISFTFHVDRGMKVRQFFEDWLHRIVNPNDFTVSYQDTYTSTMYVRQLDEQNNVTHEIKFNEVFPRNINMMELNHSSQNQTHRITVLFAYRYWERTLTSSTYGGIDLADTSPLVQYPQVPIVDTRVR